VAIEAADGLGTGDTTIDVSPSHPTRGHISARRYSEPFGEARCTPPLTFGAFPDDHTFLGKTTDAGTGLVDMGARKYDPATGRFLSADPVFQPGSPQTMGGYAYAGNDPVNSSDPTGLTKCDADPGACSHDTQVAVGAASPCDNQTGYGKRECEQTEVDERPAPPAAHTCNASCQQGRIAAARYTNQDPASQNWMTITTGNPSLSKSQNAINAYKAGARGGPVSVGDVLLDVANFITDYRAIEDCPHDVNASCVLAVVGDLPIGKITKASKVTKLLRASDDADAAASRAIGDLCAAAGHSFKADTPVEMADGPTRPIQEVKVGDEIENAQPNGHDENHRVDQVHVTRDDKDFTDLIVATPSGPATITSTQNHPYYDLTTNQFADASQLKPGDRLQTDAPGPVTVETVHSYTSSMVTYDLTIDGLHTYYVEAGDTPVLVHNSGCFDPAGVGAGLPEYAGGATSGTGVASDGRVYGIVSGNKSADADLLKIVNDRLRAAGSLPGAANSARASDAEQKFAATMIRDGIDNADIVINNPAGPCTVTLGCNDVLSTILGDRTLTVHWPDGNGGWASQTYGGSG